MSFFEHFQNNNKTGLNLEVLYSFDMLENINNHLLNALNCSVLIPTATRLTTLRKI